MILKHQSAAQSIAWNGVIMFLFNKTPGIKKRLKHAKKIYSTLKKESNHTIRGMRILRQKKLGLLQQMVLVLEEEEVESSEEEDFEDGDAQSKDDKALIKEAASGEDEVGGDDDDDKGLDTASQHSFTSRRSRVKRRGSNASEKSSPHWMRSSRSKMSQSIHRDISQKQRSEDAMETKVDDPLMPSSAGEDIGDDEIEKFLNPNGPKKKPRNSAKRRTRNGSKLISNMKLNIDIGDDTIPSVPKPSGLPSELVISSQTIVSHLHDDASSIDSSSIRTPASTSEPSEPSRKSSLADIRRRKRELEDLRLSISKSFDGLEEEEE
jgi:hypothetical protein